MRLELSVQFAKGIPSFYFSLHSQATGQLALMMPPCRQEHTDDKSKEKNTFHYKIAGSG
jgi:hypothetical protein